MKALSIICIVLCILGCSKDNSSPSASSTNPPPPTLTVTFQNTEANPYTIYIDGTNEGILASGNTSGGFNVNPTTSHTLKAVQYSGYILYPTTYTLNTPTYSTGSNSYNWQF